MLIGNYPGLFTIFHNESNSNYGSVIGNSLFMIVFILPGLIFIGFALAPLYMFQNPTYYGITESGEELYDMKNCNLETMTCTVDGVTYSMNSIYEIEPTE